MKNYTISFINQTKIGITAEQAAKITQEWYNGATVILVGGNVYPTHQIAAIERVDRQTEKDLCQAYNLQIAPTIENYLKLNQSQNAKQLRTGKASL